MIQRARVPREGARRKGGKVSRGVGQTRSVSGYQASSPLRGVGIRRRVAFMGALALLVGLAVPGNAFAAKPSGGGGGGGGGTKTPPSNVAFTPPVGLAGGGAEPSIRNSV